MLTLSILSVLFTQDTCATGSSILTCEIRKEVFLHGYKSARALRKTNTARISKVIYVGIARKVSLFHFGTCRVSGLQNIFFHSHINAPHYIHSPKVQLGRWIIVLGNTGSILTVELWLWKNNNNKLRSFEFLVTLENILLVPLDGQWCTVRWFAYKIYR